MSEVVEVEVEIEMEMVVGGQRGRWEEVGLTKVEWKEVPELPKSL